MEKSLTLVGSRLELLGFSGGSGVLLASKLQLSKDFYSGRYAYIISLYIHIYFSSTLVVLLLYMYTYIYISYAYDDSLYY